MPNALRCDYNNFMLTRPYNAQPFQFRFLLKTEQPNQKFDDIYKNIRAIH